MLNLSLPRLSPGIGHRRPPRLARAVAQAEAALVRLAPLLEAQVEAYAERGDGTAGAWALLCQVEELLADLRAQRATGEAAPAGGSKGGTSRAG
jgi:hypothetical protein